MTARSHTLEVIDSPELIRLARRVLETGESVTLTLNGEVLAVITPPRRARARPVKRLPWDEEAFWEAAGGWQGLVDGEQLKRDIADSRGSNRPAYEL